MSAEVPPAHPPAAGASCVDAASAGQSTAGPLAAGGEDHENPNPLWGDDWSQVRALWPLEQTVAHLNHGSYGAVPSPVLEEQQSWRIRMEGNPVRFFNRELPTALSSARDEVAAFLGADSGSVAFVRNATAGVSTVLRAFPLAPGDAVLVTDHAYGAVRIAAQRWTARASAVLDTLHLPLGDDEEALALLLGAVRDETRIVVLDQVTSPTARRLPLASMIRALHARGVAVLIDGAHAPGMLPVDLGSLGADFWTGNLHKWCCAPRGTAVLHAAGRWSHLLRPLVASWGESRGFPDGFHNTGTDDPTPWLAAPRALRLLDHLGWERVRRHNVALAVDGQELVAGSLGVPVAGLPRDIAVSMQLVPLPEGLVTTGEQAAALQDRIGTIAAVEVAVTCWSGRGYLRLSAHVYNAPADYRRLAADLPALV